MFLRVQDAYMLGVTSRRDELSNGEGDEISSSRLVGPWASVLLAGLLAASISLRGANAREPPDVLAGKKIVLDAGHGGSDAGATNARSGISERSNV